MKDNIDNGHSEKKNYLDQNSQDLDPLVTLEVVPKSGSVNCPFGNEGVVLELVKGGCVFLAGNSGVGKTTLATYLAGLSSQRELTRLGIDIVRCEWDGSIPKGERCGVLFQQTALLDALTVAGNISIALQSCSTVSSSLSPSSLLTKVKDLMEAVGLVYERDASKYPTELSGGMARRASLALQLAQRKRVIVLDEPFTGLDPDAAASVATELVHLRKTHGTSLLLISHEPDIAALVMDPAQTTNNTTINLKQNPTSQLNVPKQSNKLHIFGTRLVDRYLQDLLDYVFWSLPLILLAFVATGLAISLLSADILNRIDVTDKVLEIVDQEVKPMIKLLTGEEPGSITMMMVKIKVRNMIGTTLPKARASLYAIGMAKLFVLEIGPLLTALLLCGRIGGSYAGKVATMQATFQNKLLRTLGINPQTWTLVPALGAALIAGPLLTVIGTSFALFLGAIVADKNKITDYSSYLTNIQETTFPTLRLVSVLEWSKQRKEGVTSTCHETIWGHLANLNLHCTFSESYWDSIIEIMTYPPIFLLIKSSTFILIILIVAEISARVKPNLSARNVPHVITSSVVISGLLVLIFDWAFSQLWLLRK